MVHRVSSAPHGNFDRRGRRNPPLVLQSIQTSRGQSRSYPGHQHRRHQTQQQQHQEQRRHHHHDHHQQQQPMVLSAYKQVQEDDASGEGAIFTPTASASKQSLDPIFSPKNLPDYDESDDVAILATPEQRRPVVTEHDEDDEDPSFLSICFLFCKRSPKLVPRLFSIAAFILLPSFVLIGICVLTGWGLANLESPLEYDLNDAILAERFALLRPESNGTVDELLDLPAECWRMYLLNGDISGLSAQYFDITEDSNGLTQASLEGKNETYLLEVATNAMKWFETSVGDIETFMAECGRNNKEKVQTVIEGGQKLSIDARSEELTFNWIRCWDVTENGSHRPYGATRRQIEASSNQADFYENIWKNDQQRLFEMYSESEQQGDRSAAWEKSLAEATGRTGCSENISAAAWFWFTIMTTMGYGNQSPETMQGRAMTCILGFLCVLMFLGVLVNAGNVVTVIFDDFTARSKMEVLSRPLVGCLLWGTVTSAWVLFMAKRAHQWWAERIGLDDLDVSYLESVWFASNSITTVGLGDYFFQPEMIFFGDVLRFSFLFLTAFVFLSTFLFKFGSFLSTAFSATIEKVNERVRNTSLLTFEQDDFDTINQRNNHTVQLLQEVFQVEIVEAEAAHSYKTLDIVSKEERLLKKLLELKQSERLHLEHKKNISYLEAMLIEEEDEEKSLALIQEEEDLLRKLLLKKEIEKKEKQLVTYVSRAKV